MLANATLLDLSELGSAFEENKIRAEETYLGNSFKALCFVDKIESDYFEYYAGNLTVIRVYTNKDELKELNTKEEVNIIGIIDSIETESGQDAIGTPLEWKVIKMDNAYCLDKTIYGVFMVNKFDSSGNREAVCIANPVQILNGDIVDIDTNEMYRISLGSEILSTLNIEDFILVSGTVSRRDEAFIDQHTNVFELNSANLIVNGHDEVIEYIKQSGNELN